MSLDAAITAAVKASVREVIAEWGAPKLLLTVEQAADMLSFSKEYVLNEVAAGRLTAVGERKAMRIERVELDRWIASNRRR